MLPTPSLMNKQPPEPPPGQDMTSQVFHEHPSSLSADGHSRPGFDARQFLSDSQGQMSNSYLQPHEESVNGQMEHFPNITAEPHLFSYAPYDYNNPFILHNQMYSVVPENAVDYHTQIPLSANPHENDIKNANMAPQILPATSRYLPTFHAYDNVTTNPFLDTHNTSQKENLPCQIPPSRPALSDTNGNEVESFPSSECDVTNGNDNIKTYHSSPGHVTFDLRESTGHSAEQNNTSGTHDVDNGEYMAQSAEQKQRCISDSDTVSVGSSLDMDDSAYTNTISSVNSATYLLKPLDSDEEAAPTDEDGREYFLNDGYTSGSSTEVLDKQDPETGSSIYHEDEDEKEEMPLLEQTDGARVEPQELDETDDTEAKETDPLKQVQDFVHHHLLPITESDGLNVEIHVEEIEPTKTPSIPPSPVIPSPMKYGRITNNLTVADESFLFHSMTSLSDKRDKEKGGRRATTMQNLHERNSFLNLTHISKVGRACQRGLIFLKDDLTFGSLASLNAMAAKNLKDPAQEISLIEENKEVDVIPSKKHRKNVLALSIVISLYFISTGSVRNLQSSLNHEGGVGIISIALSFVGYMLGSIFSASIVVSFQPRKCIIINLIPSLIYVGANIYPSVWLIAPMSLVQGLSLSIIWNAMSTYVTFLSRGRALKKGEDFEKVSANFFGIFCLIYQSYHIVGNLIASLVLMPGGGSVPGVVNNTLLSNSTNLTALGGENAESGVLFEQAAPVPVIFELDSITENLTLMDVKHLTLCGAEFCNHFEVKGSGVSVSDETKYLLFSIYMGCIIVAMAIAGFVLEPLNPRLFPSSDSNMKRMKQQLISLMKFSVNGRFLLLFPILMYSIMQFGFIAGEVTMAFVTCPLGIHMVGYTMICFGLSGSLTSYISGILSKYTGRIPFILCGGALNIGVLIFMLKWYPQQDNLVPYFVMMGLWGVSDGIWNCQINSLVGVVFPDKYEEAYAGLRFAQGLGVALLFSFSNVVCMTFKIYFVGGVVIISLILYLVVEISLKREVVEKDFTIKKQTSV